MHNKPGSEPVVLFATPPSLQDLCGITVGVTSDVTHSQVASTWQPQILKCREIIFTEQNVIASPTYDRENCFEVVLQQSLFKTGKLQNRFQKIGLEISKPRRVTPAMYQSCLKYTLTARLAPTWNKAGEWLIQGRDFLTHTGYTNAVKMNLTVNNEELFVSLLADCVKFPPLQLMDLDVDEHFMRQIASSGPYRVTDMTMFNCWCHVLPSTKRGRICSVSRSVPQEGPFKSYRDLKRHWKNTYGYRLPENEEEVLFFEISFRQNGGKLFTYPNVCLRAMQMQRIPRIDPKPILISFIQDLHSKLPTVCGHPFKFLPKVRYAIPELYECAQEKGSVPLNLSNKNPHGSTVPLRNMKDLTHMYTHKQQVQIMHLPTQNTVPNDTNKNNLGSQKSSYDTSKSGISMAALMANHEGSSASRVETNSSTQTQARNQNLDDVIPPSQNSTANRIIPVFKPKMFKPSTVASVQPNKTVPMFKPKPKLSLSSKPNPENPQWRSTDNQAQKILNNGNSSETPSASSSVQLPRAAPSYAKTTNLGKMPSFERTPAFTPTVNHISKQPKPIMGSTKSPAVKQAHPKMNCSRPNQALPCTPSNRALKSPQVSGSPGVKTYTANSTGMKRPSTEEREEGSKKPRAKPQVQDVDVEMLARANQLGKVNSVTLLAWLRQKNVPCKAKDKKTDLIKQVYHMLNLLAPES